MDAERLAVRSGLFDVAAGYALTLSDADEAEMLEHIRLMEASGGIVLDRVTVFA